MIADGDLLKLAAAANRAPSVHNIQPTRFRFDDVHTITLLEDTSRRLFVGDPEGRDNQKSLGAATEGLALALSERGLSAEVQVLSGEGEVRERARVTLAKGAPPDALAPFAEARASYRGAFAPRSDADHGALQQIAAACPDLHIVEGPDIIAEVARFFDETSLDVLREPKYRAELLSWMRLSKDNPNYARDGLNAEHMALSPIEAFGAGVVLGPKAFPTLDKTKLAGPLIAESGKVKSAAGVALFHRPTGEPEFETGRRFYRVWLEIERTGLALCPMSVLADVPFAAARVLGDFGIVGRKLVTVFRIGRRPPNARRTARARLPASELII